MIGQFLITFREVFEAALITSIILAYLARTKKGHYSRYIWYGVILSIIASLIFGLGVWAFYGELSEAGEKLFEGLAAIIAVVVLTSMILWMAFIGRYIKHELQTKVDIAVTAGTVFSLVAFAFIVVFREGLETVLFLTPFAASDGFGTLAGAGAGMIAALVFSFVIFKVGKDIELKSFFYFSSLLLVFLAAGLLGYGIHELIEYQETIGTEPGMIGIVVYNLGIDSDSIFHHKGVVGSIFAVMFGYSVKMELGRIVAHFLYLAVFVPLTFLAYKKPEKLEFLSRFAKELKSFFTKTNLVKNN